MDRNQTIGAEVLVLLGNSLKRVPALVKLLNLRCRKWFNNANNRILKLTRATRISKGLNLSIYSLGILSSLPSVFLNTIVA